MNKFFKERKKAILVVRRKERESRSEFFGRDSSTFFRLTKNFFTFWADVDPLNVFLFVSFVDDPPPLSSHPSPPTHTGQK